LAKNWKGKKQKAKDKRSVVWWLLLKQGKKLRKGVGRRLEAPSHRPRRITT